MRETEAASHADVLRPVFRVLAPRPPREVEHDQQLLLEGPRHHAIDDEVDRTVDQNEESFKTCSV